MKNYKIFYHASDLDGYCSGAVVYQSLLQKNINYDQITLHSINYGQKFPFGTLEKDDTVFMVDFTLQPFDLMEKLNVMCNLVWIDHHKTELEEAVKRNFNPPGLRRIGTGACELCWEYFWNSVKVPDTVKYLSQYDVWNHADPKVLPFQYGFRMFENTLPDNHELWEKFLCYNPDVNKIIQNGKLILQYEAQQNAKFCKAYAFETILRYAEKINSDTPSGPADEILYEYTAICANRGFTNSKLFDSIYDPEKHDLMITFQRLKLPRKQWTVSLYSTKKNIDCGAIARHFGGGGHAGAAGYQCDELPFEY